MKEEVKKQVINMKKNTDHIWKNGRFLTFVKVASFILLVLVLTSIMTLYLEDLPSNLKVGEIAGKDFKANKNYEIIDEKSTEQQKKQALESVKPVYDHDLTINESIRNKIKNAFKNARQVFTDLRTEARKTIDNQDENVNSAETVPSEIKIDLNKEQEDLLKKNFQTNFGISIADEQYRFLRKNEFSQVWENVILHLFSVSTQKPIIHDKKDLEIFIDQGISIRNLKTEEDEFETTVSSLDSILDLNDADAVIKNFPSKEFKEFFTEQELSKDGVKVSKTISRNLVKANLTYNGVETETRQQKAISNVKNIIIKVKRGEAIIRSGDRFEPWHLTVLEGIRLSEVQLNQTSRFIGLFFVITLLLIIPYYYASRYIREFKPNFKDMVFLGGNLALFLLILRVGVFMSASLRETLPFETGVATLYYAIPIAAAAMLVRFVLNSEIALIFAVIISLLTGIFLQNNLELTLYYMIGSIFAAHAITRVDKRSTVFLFGLLLGLVNAATIISLNLLGSASLEGINYSILTVNALVGFGGGLITAMMLLILSPVVEAIFNYTTDIKLLELATLSHPLLKEMIVKSPGTYHHSQLVGVLAEAGAQAIGANPLLARVASYYHDIGKMKKSQYFIENQRGQNPHDKLSPSMSALIIAAHVKDGIEMAKKYKLPQKIADMIPQHQGTKVIGYFYNKAKQSMDPSMGTVDEADYRYPGPRPQTREAGVIMLADAIEAAVRSLPEKSPAKIKAMVEKLVNMHFVDEQLDECDLTLKDLHLIAGAFTDILIGIYHNRIEYPQEHESAQKSEDVQVIHSQKVRTQDGNSSQQSSSNISNIQPLFKDKSK